MSYSKHLLILQSYDPAKGDPNIPTASSAQTRKKANKTAPQIIILYSILFTFLNTSSHNKPVPNNKIPIMVKSAIPQSTSFVNCMAMKGISNRNPTDERMMINLLFFIVVLFFVFILCIYCLFKKLFNSVYVFFESVFTCRCRSITGVCLSF